MRQITEPDYFIFDGERNKATAGTPRRAAAARWRTLSSSMLHRIASHGAVGTPTAARDRSQWHGGSDHDGHRLTATDRVLHRSCTTPTAPAAVLHRLGALLVQASWGAGSAGGLIRPHHDSDGHGGRRRGHDRRGHDRRGHGRRGHDRHGHDRHGRGHRGRGRGRLWRRVSIRQSLGQRKQRTRASGGSRRGGHPNSMSAGAQSSSRRSRLS